MFVQTRASRKRLRQKIKQLFSDYEFYSIIVYESTRQKISCTVQLPTLLATGRQSD